MTPARTTAVRTAVRIAIPLLIAVLGACRENPLISEANDRPVAVARVILPSGMAADATTDPVMKQDLLQFPFDGAPIDIKLDGTASSDKDGELQKYMWQSGTLAPDGGVTLPEHRKELIWMPEGSQPGWPADEASPTVRITEAGVYSFNLWVIDDRESVSEPDAIKFTVGNAVDPAVAACMGTVLPSVPAECSQCMCGKGDMCRMAVAESACGEACWTFIRCLGAKCPMFRAMAAQTPPDYSCLTSMCMAEFTAGQTGASAVGMCIAMCPTECAAMPTMMP